MLYLNWPTLLNPKTKNDVESLAEHGIGSFEFLVGMTIWHNLLFAVNFVSKVFQNEDMRIDVIVDQLKGLIAFIEKYIETRFVEAMIKAKEVAARMNVEPALQEKRIICRKRQFDKNNSEEMTQSVEKSFRVKYFLYIVDQALPSLQSRFE